MKYHKSPADLRLDKLQAKKILNEIRANRRKSCAPINSEHLKGCVAFWNFPNIPEEPGKSFICDNPEIMAKYLSPEASGL